MCKSLARRPAHSATAQQVHMNMEYGLAGTLVAVEYQAVTVFIDAFISSDLPGDKRHLARYCYVLVLEVINCRNMLLRYD